MRQQYTNNIQAHCLSWFKTYIIQKEGLAWYKMQQCSLRTVQKSQ